MAGTRLLVAGATVLSAVAPLLACVEVPDGVRAHFAEARDGERSNFRRGPKGLAPPVEPGELFTSAAPAASSAAPQAKAASASLADAGSTPSVDAVDGGAP